MIIGKEHEYVYLRKLISKMKMNKEILGKQKIMTKATRKKTKFQGYS